MPGDDPAFAADTLGNVAGQGGDRVADAQRALPGRASEARQIGCENVERLFEMRGDIAPRMSCLLYTSPSPRD